MGRESQSSAVSGKRLSFDIPRPVLELLRAGEEYFTTSHLVHHYWPFIKKIVEWTVVYWIAILGFGYGWILFLVRCLSYL